MTDTLRERLQASLGSTYVLERELGGGGMSRVFVALDTSLGRRVVVKVLPGETVGGVSLERFKREIQLAARLQHPHIIPVLTAGETEGVPYYTMPYVSDETLRTKLEAGRLSLAEAVRMLREIARALAFAHKEGVVHRDIKPENVLLSGGVAAVTDFGVAKAVSAASTLPGVEAIGTLTSIGVALGTPMYLSPEQASGESNIDHRADIYSFGCVAYELLTGAPPFTDRSAVKLMAAHVMETPEPILKRRPDLPAPLASLVMRCLAKSPDERPQSADEIVDALDSMTTPSGGRTAVTGARLTVPLGGGRRMIAAGAVLVLIVLAVAWGLSKMRAGGTATGADARSIAVLPFTNLSGNKENEYFSDGITEEITNALTKAGLSVASRSVAAAASAKGADARQVGQALKVYAVLSGSIQRDGDKVRISAQLVNTATGRNLWGNRYDEQFKDVFDVQDKIARAIVSELQPSLVGDATRSLVGSHTESAEAHNLYLQGLYFWNRRTAATIQKAISFFEQAIAKDSGYARAYAGLALSYAVLTDYADLDTKATLDKAITMANGALARDSSLAEAWTAIGFAEAKEWHGAKADSAMRRAIALDSTFGTAHHWYSFALMHVGRFDDGLREIRIARDLEPLSLIINSNVGRMDLLARKFDDARAAVQHTLDLDSNFGPPYEHLASVELHARRFTEAIAAQERRIALTGTRPTMQLALLGHAYAVAGRTAEARAIRDEIVSRASHESISEGGLALLYSVLGEHDKALSLLEKGVNDFDAMLYLYSRDERFDALRKDPRGAALLARTEAMQ